MARLMECRWVGRGQDRFIALIRAIHSATYGVFTLWA